jgi:hypothetical protein
VSVTDTLPVGTTFVTATATCAAASGTLTCDVGTLPSGQSSTLNVTVLAMTAGTLTNGASVVSSIDDPDTTNNAFSAAVTVSPVPAASTGDGTKTDPLNVVLTGSYVLISGRSVKLVKRRFVPVKLTCAGPRKCEGTITISTAKPIKATKQQKKGKKHKKRKRRVARLGSKKFAIEGNRQQKVLVPLTKSKIKLLRRLKRVKAKADIREIDLHGNPRLSTRTFTLRTR